MKVGPPSWTTKTTAPTQTAYSPNHFPFFFLEAAFVELFGILKAEVMSTVQKWGDEFVFGIQMNWVGIDVKFSAPSHLQTRTF